MTNRRQDIGTTPTPERRPEETDFDRLVRDLDALPKGYVQVINGEHIGRIIALNRSMTRLGLSGDTCAIVANRGDEGYFLTPLEGKAFPLVNGEPTGDTTIRLVDGAIIEIDGVQMKFHKGNASAADTAP